MLLPLQEGASHQQGKFVSDENYKKFCADVDLLHTVTKPEIFVVGLELLQPWSLLSTSAPALVSTVPSPDPAVGQSSTVA